MRVLLDPNILLPDNDKATSFNLMELLRILKQLNAKIIIHQSSIEYLERLADRRQESTALSKIPDYVLLDIHPDPKNDRAYSKALGNATETGDMGNIILYSVYKDSVDFLITEDRNLHKKANILGIDDRVLLVDEALRVFLNYVPEYGVIAPLPLKNEPVRDLNLEDPIFDPLKREYPEFQDWFKKISNAGRRGWVYYRNDGSIGALLIQKVEDEPIDSVPPIPEKRRLKISTLKVTHVGYKIGELFIKLATDIALINNISEIYLTHFTQPDDRLIELISEYGFNKIGVNSKGEEIFIKKLVIEKDEAKSYSPMEISKKFYPSFYDGKQVKKFVVPIRPGYHNRLFTDFTGRQTTLSEHAGEFIVEGNTIKKAYLSHSKIRRMEPGDLLLFYRSEDLQAITSIGVVEAVYTGIEEVEEIVKLVGKRTVFTRKEIEELTKKPVSIFLFRHHFHLDKRLTLDELTKAGILAAAPQSAMEVSTEDYIKIKMMGDIDERFTIDQAKVC